MPDQPTFNARMVAKLEALLLENVGAQSVTVDGQSVAYADLVEQLATFEKRLAIEQGTKRRVAGIHLGGF
jgi:hypothetical protein